MVAAWDCECYGNVKINFDIPHLDPSENLARVKALLLHALGDMVTCSAAVLDEDLDSALDAAARELAADAEVL